MNAACAALDEGQLPKGRYFSDATFKWKVFVTVQIILLLVIVVVALVVFIGGGCPWTWSGFLYALALSGFVSAEEALAGFSSPAPASPIVSSAAPAFREGKRSTARGGLDGGGECFVSAYQHHHSCCDPFAGGHGRPDVGFECLPGFIKTGLEWITP